MIQFSPESMSLIEELSLEDRPFHYDTLTRYINRPGADEVIIEREDGPSLSGVVVIGIINLIREEREKKRAHLSLVPPLEDDE